jgi:hypothetical protein
VKRRRQGRGEDPFHDTSVMQGYAAWSFDVVQQLDYKVASLCRSARKQATTDRTRVPHRLALVGYLVDSL